jgi:hypothetical protein
MRSAHLKNLQQFKYNRKRRLYDENESDDEYLLIDTTSISTTTKSSNSIKIKTSSIYFFRLSLNTEILIGIDQKPHKVIDWLPVISIILAAIICLIAFIILCKRHMYVCTKNLSIKLRLIFLLEIIVSTYVFK